MKDAPDNKAPPDNDAFRALWFLGRILSLMLRLAAPRMLARIPSEKLREAPEQTFQHLDEYLALIDRAKAGGFGDADGQIMRTEESTRRVRALLQEWSFSGQAPPELMQAARDFHTAFYGAGDPPGGWDEYDLPEDDDAGEIARR